jgi:hypothetical protein
MQARNSILVPTNSSTLIPLALTISSLVIKKAKEPPTPNAKISKQGINIDTCFTLKRKLLVKYA